MQNAGQENGIQQKPTPTRGSLPYQQKSKRRTPLDRPPLIDRMDILAGRALAEILGVEVE